MGLELRKGRGGKLRPTWYGRLLTVEGKGRIVNLKVKWRGTPPPNLRELGDDKFEVSRKLALAQYKSLQAEALDKENAAYHTKKLVQFKTGRVVEYVRLAELPAKWRGLGRENQPTKDWLKWCDTVFQRFAESVPCVYLHEVTPEQATAYTESLRAGFTQRTARGMVSLLRSAFARLLPLGTINPFGVSIRSRRRVDDGSETVHRRPLTAPELVTLLATARPDPFLYPLTVCAACTGLRIGDVCQLAWQSVDMDAGVVAVRTSKTGKAVEIPIFKPLRDVFKTALADRMESPYVWPEAARMYETNRYGITYRGKALFARAFATPPKAKPTGPAQMPPDLAELAERIPQAVKAVRAAAINPAKRERILDTLARYARGESYRKIEAETGRGRGQISEDLKEAETASGLRLRHGATEASKRDIKTLITETRQKRAKGKGVLSSSLLGWHSLRGTWATLALSAGIPVETVKLVTGHGTANTVLKFYYNPQRDHLREVLGDKLPAVMTGGKQLKTRGAKLAALPEAKAADPVASLAMQLRGLSKADRARLAALLAESKAV